MLWFTIAASASAGAAIAGQKSLRPLEVSDILDLRDLHGKPDFHPFADLVAVTLSRRRDAPPPDAGSDPHFLYAVDSKGVPTSEAASRVSILDLSNGFQRPVLSSEARSWAPTWSPDGERLAFLSDDGGHIGLFVWNRANSTSTRIHLPVSPMVSRLSPRPVWLPDSRHILIPMRNSLSPAYDGDIPSAVDRTEGIKVLSSPGNRPSPGNDLAALLRGDIVLVDVDEQREEVILQNVDAIGLWLSPDGKWLAVERTLGAAEASQQIGSRLSFIDMETRAVVNLDGDLKGGYGSLEGRWSPDSKAFIYLNDGGISAVRPLSRGSPVSISVKSPLGVIASGQLSADAGIVAAVEIIDGAGNRVSQILEFDTESGRLEVLASSGNYVFLSIVRDADVRRSNEWLVLGRDVQSQEAVILRIDRPGHVQLRRRGKLAFSSLVARRSLKRKDTIFAFLEQSDWPTELWRVNDRGDSRVRLSNFNKPLGEVAFAAPRLLRAKYGADKSLTGVLLVPRQWRPGLRCPLIVRPYGGQRPGSQLFKFGVNNTAVENLQLLASRGYAVLVPDLPIDIGEPIKSVRERVRVLVEQASAVGVADTNRLGVFGHSFGGYAATALMTDEEAKFRAAVVTAPVGLDLFSYYGFLDRNGSSAFVAWTEGGQGSVGANAWTDPAALLANSPLFQIDKIGGPLLIVQGSADQPRVPQSNELFVGLRRLGKRAEYRLYPGETHWAGEWGASNTADYLSRMLGWFTETLASPVDRADPQSAHHSICY